MAPVSTVPGNGSHTDGSQHRAGVLEGAAGDEQHGIQETAAEKIERSRKLNLAAQARYRRKLADSVRDLEAALVARQREVSKAGDRRVNAYTRNRELHARDARALATLITLAGTKPPRSECSRPEPQPPEPAGPPWSVKSTLRQSIAAFYTPPPDTCMSAPAAGRRGRAASAASLQAPVPAPLSGPQLLAALPRQDAPAGLPYACAPSKGAAAAAKHVRAPNSQDPSALTAAATVARFSGELRQLRDRVGAEAGAPGGAVRWFLQSPWTVASGAAVSLTAQMSAPASVASFYLCTFTLHLEDLFVAAALYPNECLPAIPGTSTLAPQGGPGGCDADAAAVGIYEELQCMVDAAYGPGGCPERREPTTELCCGVGTTHPVARGVPHVVSAACMWYRQRLPRRQWLQVLSAFVCAIGSKRTFASGMHAHETCRHRQQRQDGEEVHAVPSCLRCSVHVSALQALQQCITQDTEGPSAVRVMSTEQIRSRVMETASFAALLQSQFLLDEPWLSRSLLHSCGVAKHLAETEQQMVVTLYSRLKFTPQQRQLTAALWKCWASRRRAHDRVYAAALRQLLLMLPLGPLWPLCVGDYVGRGGRHASGPEPAGSSRAVILHTHNALKALRACHRQDGDMLGEVTRALRMPGTFFVPEQLVLAFAITAQHSMRSVDWLWVCRCAAEDVAREAMFAGID